MRNAIAIFIFGSLALCLFVAGCGSGSSSGGEGSSIDKAAFVKQADEICEQASGKLAAEVTATNGGETGTPGGLIRGILIPGLEAELEELRALGIPEEGKAEVQAFLKAAQKVIARAEADPEKFAASASPYEAVELTGRKFGVTACPLTVVKAAG